MYCASSPLVGRNQHAPEIMERIWMILSSGNIKVGFLLYGVFSLPIVFTKKLIVTYGAIRETIAYLSYGLSSGIDRKFKMMKIIQVRSIGGIYNGSVKHS
ncbi:8256_t:CDS:2 [Scutellospora calospora]|uniref:8256_t:CDS:1 n=1 Tax=Scutellospora calospora TaxID=85575 RepID=A0ACA9JTQ7_9GLOM|nr:8256_t:CDS:2 [Scutellospora calospora]